MKQVFSLISILVLSIAIFAAAACCHDNIIMRRNNESMRQTVAEMKQQQAQQAAEIRQIKTDAETALRVVVMGDYMEVE